MSESASNGTSPAGSAEAPRAYRNIPVGMEGAMDEVDLNSINAVARVTIASPDQIMTWVKRRRRANERTGPQRPAPGADLFAPEVDTEDATFGEVKKPETINYRTFKPEKDGLFCERIFGPVKDWECACGKYKRIKYKGIVCDRCGVEVTEAKVRRVRMGYISLAAPVAHIWFYKGTSSKIGNLLDISVRDLSKVIYFQEYIVTDADPETGVKAKEIIAEDVARKYRELHGDKVKIRIGAEAIFELLKQIDVDDLANRLQIEMREATSAQKRNKIIKRLKVVEAFRNSPNLPEWMVLTVLPVLPPDLRPLVHLDGGRFATSDLNDLYRRVINRNNRLRRLIEIKAPDVILRNEKRMLQEAVDALFDNSRRGRPTKGHNNRPLKSLADMLKGKQGRFRQNLLGKRVDYSGRSVIVVGPELSFNECGLPKKMALELFDPFIIRELERRGHCNTIKSAKKMIEREDPVVYDILADVIRDHPVLLNRAPTLHRLGIQAFMPRLIEGKAIRLHPLACTAFNADFDGDQMAVHVPLSTESRLEAKLLMLAENNILSPSSGRPIATPSQDMVLGIYYLTKIKPFDALGEYKEWRKGPDGKTVEMNRSKYLEMKGTTKDSDFDAKYKLLRRTGVFASPEDALKALEHGKLHLQAEILVRFPHKTEEGRPLYVFTSAGRLIFRSLLPSELDFLQYANEAFTSKKLAALIGRIHELVGNERTARALDEIKNKGFAFAKRGGLSIAMSDMVIPPAKPAILTRAAQRLEQINKDYANGNLTDEERYHNVISVWTQATDDVTKELMATLAADQGGFNPVFIMSYSGARGNKDQIRQLAGMRGLMQRPSKSVTGSIGEIIESPILSNFREGLTVLEYFISTHGARKGLADTALKTSDAGYLTRRLCDVAQDLIITEDDCGTTAGITARPIIDVDARGEKIIEPLRDRIVGRCPVDDVYHPSTGVLILGAGQEITEKKARAIEDAGISELEIRSVLTCQTRRGICRRCYGRNLATGRLVELGESIGIIAAQSIGEPGTQLTLRTFHTGGVSMGVLEGWYEADTDGYVKYEDVKSVKNADGELICANRTGNIKVFDNKDNEIQTLPTIPYGARLLVADGGAVAKGTRIVQWDPSAVPILAERDGVILHEDIIEGVTVKREVDPETERAIYVVAEYREDTQPKLVVANPKDHSEVYASYSLATGTILSKEAMENAVVRTGQVIARVPKPRTKSRDITGGLPRVEELFEARKPKECAFIADIPGTFEMRGIAKGARKCAIVAPNGEEHTYSIPLNRNLFVRDGEHVDVGDVLTDGSKSPHDILRVLGEKSLMEFLLQEVQEVYRLQGVGINDKHIESIVRQMLKKIVIEEPGNTRFLYGQTVDKWLFQEENERVVANGGEPAVGKPKLLGLTKASLETESFIAAASFQETTRVLTDAAVRGRRDFLRGLKENVIMGLLIPAGTGLPRYRGLLVDSPDDQKSADREDELEATGPRA
ncbi:MAG: DNA-directed RNA polymerase subunit beta' [Candidatus Sumerlaeia bacterium]|nr:DNA-directed RNA polymerase subunit beta' [Candidatus Sumerlaeia bacterium]